MAVGVEVRAADVAHGSGAADLVQFVGRQVAGAQQAGAVRIHAADADDGQIGARGQLHRLLNDPRRQQRMARRLVADDERRVERVVATAQTFGQLHGHTGAVDLWIPFAQPTDHLHHFHASQAARSQRADRLVDGRAPGNPDDRRLGQDLIQIAGRQPPQLHQHPVIGQKATLGHVDRFQLEPGAQRIFQLAIALHGMIDANFNELPVMSLGQQARHGRARIAQPAGDFRLATALDVIEIGYRR